ncbi:MAG: YfhO family protein [Chloroflexota bacterium]
MTAGRARWLPFGAILALVLLFNPGLAFRGLIDVDLDAFAYFYPLRTYFARAVWDGRLPLWNPDLFMGSPFLANPQTAVFYPGTWLFALLPVPYAYSVNLLAHYVLAGGSLFILAHGRLGLPLGAALVGGAAFAVSGILTGHHGHLNQISAIAWMPLTCAVADAWLVDGRRRRFLGLSACVALQILAGHPQAVYITVFAVAAVALWRLTGEAVTTVRLWRTGAIGLALLLAAGLTAVQLLPTAELSAQSVRADGLPFAEATSVFVPWELLLPVLLPGYWSNLASSEQYGHIGAGLFGIAVLGLACGRSRPAALGAALVAVGLLLSTGPQTGLYRWLFDWAPGFSSFRVPARWLLVYTLGASILIATGVAWMWEPGRLSRPTVGRAALARATLVLGTIGPGLAWVAQYGQPQSRRLLAIWAVIGISIVGLGVAARVMRHHGRWLAGVLIVLAFMELWVVGGRLAHRAVVPAWAYAPDREALALVADALRNDPYGRVLSVATPDYEVKETQAFRESLDGFSGPAVEQAIVAVKRNEALVPNLTLVYGFRSADGYDGGLLPTRDFVRFSRAMLGDRARPDGVLLSRLDRFPDDRWLDLMGVRVGLAGRVKDETRGALYFDRAVSRRLEPGDVIEFGGLPLGELTRLALVSSHLAPPSDGAVVATVEPVTRGVALARLELRDGHETGSTVGPARPGGPEVIREWGQGGDADPRDWLAELPLPRGQIERLRFKNVGAAPFEIRAINLVDDVRQMAFSVVPHDGVSRAELFDMKVYTRGEPLPRAYFVGQAALATADQAADQVRATGFNPRDLVVLTSPDGLPRGGGGRGQVAFLTDQAERVVLQVRAQTDGYVVVSDGWYPGWRAAIDGAEAPILKANVMFRAVWVPAGEHVIELRFVPWSLWFGAAISVLSLVACGGVALARPWRRA